MRIKDVLNDASKAEDPKPKRVSEALKAYLAKDVSASSTPKVNEITIGQTTITEESLKNPSVQSITIAGESVTSENIKKPVVDEITIGGTKIDATKAGQIGTGAAG